MAAFKVRNLLRCVDIKFTTIGHSSSHFIIIIKAMLYFFSEGVITIHEELNHAFLFVGILPI